MKTVQVAGISQEPKEMTYNSSWLYVNSVLQEIHKPLEHSLILFLMICDDI